KEDRPVKQPTCGGKSCGKGYQRNSLSVRQRHNAEANGVSLLRPAAEQNSFAVARSVNPTRPAIPLRDSECPNLATTPMNSYRRVVHPHPTTIRQRRKFPHRRVRHDVGGSFRP